ncbi:MAG: glycosyltransferase [Dermatophilus congolensis]|nr:glycosyltransferase [Dermatophilus congolensis]
MHSTVPTVLVRQRDASAYASRRGRIDGVTVPRIIGHAVKSLTALSCAVTDEPVVALTYDDGPDSLQTPAILEALDSAGVKATFFVLLPAAQEHPDLVREILRRGHDLGLHGADHDRLSALSTSEVIGRIRAARAELEQIAGRPITLYRPAYGALTTAQVLAVRALGLEIVLWSVWAEDWADNPVEEMIDRAAEGAHPGGIVLLHDGAQGSAATDMPADFPKPRLTSELIARLRERGYRFAPVSELMTLPAGRVRAGESGREARRIVLHESTEQASAPHPVHGSDTLAPPVLSVVIACYNGESTLGAQLDALARQDTHERFEVIVADNGCTDRSVPLAANYADSGALDLRIVEAGAVRGPGHARNIGVAHARADLIAFCDADDVVADDWVRQMLAALREHDFVAGRVDIDVLNPAWVRRTRRMKQTDGLQHSPTAGGLAHAGAGNMGIAKQVFTQVGGFDETLLRLEDSDLCWRIQMNGTPLVYDRDVLLHTRFRATLPSIISQGFHYGSSYAQVEARYEPRDPSPDGSESTSETAGEVVADEPAPALTARLKAPVRIAKRATGYLVAHGPVGLAWNLAWHVGHRQARSRLEQEGPTEFATSLPAPNPATDPATGRASGPRVDDVEKTVDPGPATGAA